MIQHYVLYRSPSGPSTYPHLSPEAEAEIGYGTLGPPSEIPRAGGDKLLRSSPRRRPFDEEERGSFRRFRHGSEGEAPDKSRLRGRGNSHRVENERNDEGERRVLLDSGLGETITSAGGTVVIGE